MINLFYCNISFYLLVHSKIAFIAFYPFTYTVSKTFLDYETPIGDYFYIQGIGAAVGALSGQADKLDNLECVPDLKERKKALDQVSRDFRGKLPLEECAGCTNGLLRGSHISMAPENFLPSLV